MKTKRILASILAVVVLFGLTACRPAPTEETSVQTEETPKKTHTVTYYSDDDTVLKIESVLDHEAAQPPHDPEVSYGYIFERWDADLSDITQDIDVHPVCQDVREKKNVLAIPGVYVKSADTVTVPVRLCGEVCVSGFDMMIQYDPSMLSVLSLKEDGAIVYNTDTPGIIRMNFVSVENTIGDVEICEIEFSVKAESGSIPISLEMKDIYACKDTLDVQADTLYVPEYTLVDGTVFIIG